MESSDQITAAIVLLTAATIYFHFKKFSYWSSRNIKGPTPWPIFGTNVYYIFENKLTVDARWRKKYGKVYGLYEGYSPLLRVNDGELINYICVKQFRSFTDRHNEFIHQTVQKKWLLWAEGKKWSARRSLVSPLFSSPKMRTMAQSMSACINRFLELVEERLVESAASRMQVESSNGKAHQARDGKSKRAKMDKSDILAMTLDVFGTNFFSLKLDTYRDKNNEFLRQAHEVSKFDLGRFLVWMFTPRQVAKAFNFDLFQYEKFQYFDLLTQKILGERRGVGSERPQKKTDLIQLLMDAKLPDDKDEQVEIDEGVVSLYTGQGTREHQAEMRRMSAKPLVSLSDIDIRGQISFMFIAGFQPTSMTINFCLFELAHQPETQELLRNELMRVFEKSYDCIASKNKQFPSEIYHNLTDLIFLDAFISETMRLYAPILDNDRRATEPVVLPTEPKLSLPVGMPIVTNIFVLHRDPEYWSEPDKFDITRFLPENRHKIVPGTYMPFGLGSRHCLGMRFALLEIKLALAKIILNYRILPGANSKEYPPKFKQSVLFLMLENNDFELVPRESQ